MRILLLGNTGQLGWELERSLLPLGEVLALDYPEINLAEPSTTIKVLRNFQPHCILNATAYTAVDQAESEAALAYAVNATAPGLLAYEADQIGAVFIHFSTDYVFDGTKGSPYKESDTPHPLNVYGKSKLEGELAIQSVNGVYLILRTSWVYSLRRDSFVTKVLSWSRQQKSLRLVSDQVSGPTWSRMLAGITALLLAKSGDDLHNWLAERSGVYHLAGAGFCSRKEWGQAILRLDKQKHEQVVEEILPALTKDFPTPAQRPLFSALDCTHFLTTFDLQLPHWEIALKLAMAERQDLD
jgi:dTDP-4-dehydrorhamnose reductase